MSTAQRLLLTEINILAGTQSRAETNDDTVREYKEALEHGAEFPPVVVFSDGSERGKWLADGFHRYLAHRKAGLTEITCDVRVGTLRDAKLFSNGANRTHGLPRTNADKRRAVMNMLADDEWKTWSQEQIAKACGVSTGLVSKIVSEVSLHGEEIKPAARTVERNGKTYKMDTAKIGKPAAPAAATPLPILPTKVTAVASAPAPAAIASAPLEPTSEGAALNAYPSCEPAAVEDDPFSVLLGDYNKVVVERDKVAAHRDDLMAKVTELESRIELLTRSDLNAEIANTLVKRAADAEYKFEQLSGRNRDLQGKVRDTQIANNSLIDQLAKIRAALGVESNGEILAAITARRAA